MTWPLARGLAARRAGRPRRLAAHHVGHGVGRRGPVARSAAATSLRRFVERQHLPPDAAQPHLLRAPRAAGAAGPAGLPGDRQHRARLQPASSWRRSRSRASARSCSCASSPAAPGAAFVAGLFYAFFPYRLEPVPAPADAVVAVDAVCALRLPPLLRHRAAGGRWPAARRRSSCRGSRAATTCSSSRRSLAALRRVGAGQPRPLARVAHLGGAGGGRRGRARLATLPFLLPYAEARQRFGLTRPFAEVVALLGRPVRLPERAGAVAPLGRQRSTAGRRWKASSSRARCRCSLALVGRGAGLARCAHDRARPSADDAPSRERLLALVLVACAALVVARGRRSSLTGGFVWDVGGVPVRMTNVRRTLIYAARLRRRRARDARRALRARPLRARAPI